jgi:hypothetical protein
MKKHIDRIFGGLGQFFCLLIIAAAAILSWAYDAGATAPVVFFGMTALTQADTLADIVKWELENNQSREVVTVLAAQDLALGAVLGKITKGACPTTGTADAGNTGAGTCTSVTAGIKAKIGTYTIKCLIAASGAGVFTVEDPDGFALPNAIVGTAYSNDQINFTLNDGSPDFSVGDSFTVAIAAGGGQVKEIDFDAVDGSADAYGIITAACTAVADTDAVAIVRDAGVIEANLVWPSTSPAPSAAEKALAMAQLAAKGIVSRTEI